MPYRSFGALCDVVEGFTGITTAGAALVHVIAGYNRVLAGLDPRDNRVHKWSFLAPVSWLTIAENVTGTATGVYNAGTDTTTITATTAIFTPEQVGTDITVATLAAALPIASYTSTTIVVATGGEDFSGKAVSLPHHGFYDLPSDFAGLVEPPVYPWPNTARTATLTAAPYEVFDRWRQGHYTGVPKRFAVLAKAQVSGAKQTWCLTVDPHPDADYIIRYRYQADPATPTDASDKYPVGGAFMDVAYEYAALADAELKLQHTSSRMETRFQQHMVACIDDDSAFYENFGPVSMADAE